MGPDPRLPRRIDFVEYLLHIQRWIFASLGEERRYQRQLVSEDEVDGGHRHVGFGGYRLHRRSSEATAGEQAARRLKDLASGGVCLFRPLRRAITTLDTPIIWL